MDVSLSDDEFIKCKRSIFIYLEVCCSQDCAYCSPGWLFVTSRSSRSACFGLSLVWLCSDSPEPLWFCRGTSGEWLCETRVHCAPAWEMAQRAPHWSRARAKLSMHIPGVYFSGCPPPLRAPHTFLVPS